MIGLNLLKLLQDNDFGVLDESLFYQKIGLDDDGIYLTYVGEPVAKGSRDVQGYQLFARGSDDVEANRKLENIRNFLKASYSSVCNLPPVPAYTSPEYKNVTLTKPSTITTIGLDSENRTVYTLQGSIIY